MLPVLTCCSTMHCYENADDTERDPARPPFCERCLRRTAATRISRAFDVPVALLLPQTTPVGPPR